MFCSANVLRDAHLMSFFPRIAIVGSGPAGLYTCTRLLQRLPKCRVDVFDRNAVPYGLVYYGVAPDHFDMKKCTNQFERMFHDNSCRLSLFCNVSVGIDLKYEELCAAYDAVVLAYGASKARSLNVENEGAINCFSGSDFVSWYNGQPKSSVAPLLDSPNAVVVGNGNVAIDCSRILLSSPEKLSHTDLPEYAMKNLRNSRVSNVRILGRRGPIEAKFTIKELRELLNLENCSASCSIPDDVLSMVRETIVATASRPTRRLLQLMNAHSVPKNKLEMKSKQCTIEFYRAPQRILIDERGRIRELEVKDTSDSSGKLFNIPCSLLIYAIGFENILLNGLPQTDDGLLLMNDWCRVPSTMARVYATGWCAHSARGLIADSQRQAFAVADELADDWRRGEILPKSYEMIIANLKDSTRELELTEDKNRKNSDPIKELLKMREVRYVNWKDWCYIDNCERLMGALLGKPREKLHDLVKLLRIHDHQ